MGETKMSHVGGRVSLGDIELDVGQGKVPEIVKIDVPTKDVEQSYTFPNSVKQALIRIRQGSAKLKLAFNAGDIAAGKYLTVRNGTAWTEERLDVDGLTFYFSANQDNQVVEIRYWT
jgi:hypothetical protein